MQIEGSTLMPSMNSTNTTQQGSRIISKESRFQTELQTAQKRLDKAAKSGVMTEEQIAQRNKDIKDASIQLEGLILKMMYDSMWKTVPKDTLFGDDNAMDIWRDMYHEELTKQMAIDGGIGLQNFIYQQLTQTQK
ncbi:MAG: rod-binding protein [Selenomonadaceae bacterium]|nr:rod-binding protein [Selenomonadaceae bacterium]